MNISEYILAAKKSASKRLNLSYNLSEFPDEIFDLADSLEILDLSGNNLSSLPNDLWRLHKLKILFCSNNNFTQLPEVLGQCKQLQMVGFKSNKIHHVPAKSLGKSLRWLILTDNEISKLPAKIGDCKQLQKLMLSGNQLKTLPDEISFCSNLELLRISANKFTSLPDCLFKLPRLSWFAFSGNPYSETFEQNSLSCKPIQNIEWHHLKIQQKLGEGASGLIHHAQWQQTMDLQTNVAVKLFKGNITSDGFPHNEKTAWISAGSHPNLICVLGEIKNHPTNTEGLIMSLISPDYRDLASPPSLESCTRDIYPSDTGFSLHIVKRIASGLASASLQLHDKGIMHGDLYAHNIMYNLEGDCVLGDFGAASFFAMQINKDAAALQRMEVRAFGILLGELLERCNPDDVPVSLIMLQANCVQDNCNQRPLFSEIINIIKMTTD